LWLATATSSKWGAAVALATGTEPYLPATRAAMLYQDSRSETLAADVEVIKGYFADHAL